MAASSEYLVHRIGVQTAARRNGWRILREFWMTLEQWRERARQRKALLALDDRLLKDIGISRADAVREGGKPFWRD